jgi:hypothetical protein
MTSYCDINFNLQETISSIPIEELKDKARLQSQKPQSYSNNVNTRLPRMEELEEMNPEEAKAKLLTCIESASTLLSWR